ncbi:MAG: methyltransferase domain-containing protein [Lysobacterales bacterium]
MTSPPRLAEVLRGLSWLMSAALYAMPAAAQQEPDVPYVQTPSNVVDTMLEMARLTASDYLVDLGSGDGRIVIQAARRHGVRSMGVEIDPNLVRASNQEAKRQAVDDKVSFVTGNLFMMDLSRATVLTMYLLPQLNMQLRPRILTELKPGTRVVSHDFDMGDWKPDQKREVKVPNKSYGPPVSQVYFWYVPANVAGKWRWQLPVAGKPLTYEAKLSQLFQEVDGEMLVDGGSAAVQNLMLRGDLISFTLVREMFGQKISHDFNGRVEGDRISGRVQLSGGESAALDWQATRTERGTMRINK